MGQYTSRMVRSSVDIYCFVIGFTKRSVSFILEIKVNIEEVYVAQFDLYGCLKAEILK